MKKLKSIHEILPSNMIDSKCYSIGIMNDITADMWLEGSNGGTTIPMDAFDKAMDKLFEKYM